MSRGWENITGLERFVKEERTVEGLWVFRRLWGCDKEAVDDTGTMD